MIMVEFNFFSEIIISSMNFQWYLFHPLTSKFYKTINQAVIYMPVVQVKLTIPLSAYSFSLHHPFTGYDLPLIKTRVASSTYLMWCCYWQWEPPDLPRHSRQWIGPVPRTPPSPSLLRMPDIWHSPEKVCFIVS